MGTDYVGEDNRGFCNRCRQEKEIAGYFPSFHHDVDDFLFCQECWDILEREGVTPMSLYGHICKEGHGFVGEKYMSCPQCARENSENE